MISNDRSPSDPSGMDGDSPDKKRKSRIPKKGYKPPPFETSSPSDRRRSGRPTTGDRPKRSFDRSDKPSSDRPKRSFDRSDKPSFDRAQRPAGERPKRSFDKKPRSFEDRPERSFDRSERPKRSFDRSDKPSFDRPKRSYDRADKPSSERSKRSFDRGDRPTTSERPKRAFSRDGDKPAFNRDDRPKRTFDRSDKPAFNRDDRPKRSFDRTERTSNDRPKRNFGDRKPARDSFKGFGPKGIGKRKEEAAAPFRKRDVHEPASEVRLNKYISHSGVCARREADDMIVAGKVKVNGKVVTELGTRVMTTDVVVVNDVTIRFEPFKYVLMHKPKNTITTTSDEKGRKTVMDVIESEIGERVYPVGRLDRNTTGVLLLTNDGDLANRLMHPSYTVNKVYQAELNRTITEDDVNKLESGIQLEDGPAKAYHVQIGTMDPRSVQLTVHEGRNHLVRRMFEALGAEVITLKRSEFAGLVLGDIRPGRWRFLKMKEVNTLRTRVKLPELKINER